MGKKNKKSKVGGESEDSIPRNIRREILELCSLLLEKCSMGFTGQTNSDWADYLEIYNIVQKLRKKQQNYVLIGHNREEHIEGFLAWIKSNGVKLNKVALEKFGERGYGLKALKDLKHLEMGLLIKCENFTKTEAELCLSIPHKLMMTNETARKSPLGALIESDRMLQSMPNVVLALHVLCEYTTTDSFWQSYLLSLPSVYSTPLYFTPDELQHLKGSPALGDCLNQFRSIARQYAYFYRLFQGHPEASKLPIKNFCYDDYRWAVSTVMTRQNEIPVWKGSNLSSDKGKSTNGEKSNSTPADEAALNKPENKSDDSSKKSAEEPVPAAEAQSDCKTTVEGVTECMNAHCSCESAQVNRQVALIPLWDMCNHTNGQITTDFNMENGSCECFSLNKQTKDEEVCIFYGKRSNAELLLHSGFIFEKNSHDRLAVRLGLSKNDPVYSLKAEVLARVAPNTSQIFYLYSDPEAPVDGDTLGYLRIFSLDKDTLFGMLVGEKSEARRMAIRELDCLVSVENESKAWSFLQTRAQILLRSYPTTIQDDDALLNDNKGASESPPSPPLSENARLAISLRRCEKRILMNAVKFAGERLEMVKKFEQERNESELGVSKESDEKIVETAVEV